MKEPSPDREIRIPARPAPFSLSLSATALVIVDMQNAYLSKGGYLDLVGVDVSPAQNVITATQAVIAAARIAGVRIVYLQNGFSPDMREVGEIISPVYHKSKALKFMRENPKYQGKLIIQGTWDYDFVEAIRPKPGDMIVTKARYSGFAGTNLDLILRSQRVTHLILVGVNANVCVESTLRDAYHREYFALMIADATFQSGPPMIMEATIFNVETFFGWVSTTKEVCYALRQAGQV